MGSKDKLINFLIQLLLRDSFKTNINYNFLKVYSINL